MTTSPRTTTHWLSKLATALGLSLAIGSAQASDARIDHIVLVHGAFVDGSSWTPVIHRLQALGYQVTAVQNPLQSLTGDVAATEQVLRRQPGKVLLVGHSWGGAVITQAGNADNVAGLVYLSALAPDSGESVGAMMQRLHAPMSGLQPDDKGEIWLNQASAFQQMMAGDLPPQQVQLLAAIAPSIAAHSFSEPITDAAWRSKPSWYLQTSQDQALPLVVQHAIAQQIGAKIHTLTSSHLSMLSQPQAVAAWIDQAAHQAAH